MTTEQGSSDIDPASSASEEVSSSQPQSSAALVSTYRNAAARLIAVHADRVPLDVTSLAGNPEDGRTRLGVTTRPSGAARAHIAETRERYKRPRDLLGRAVLDFAAVKVITLHEGVVGGHEHTARQLYNAAGDALPEEFDESNRPLNPEEVAVTLTGITERVMDMTLDVPDKVIKEIERAMILAETQGSQGLPNPSA